MDQYNQNHIVPPNMQQQHQVGMSMSTSGQSGGQGASNNYVVQLDPNGHFELLPSARTIELGLSSTCGNENDEAVYKIRDEDFYIRGPLADQGFSEMDIDPVMDIFNRSMQQQQTQSGIQIQQPEQVHLQMQSPQVQLQMPSTSTMQFVQNSQNHQLSHQHQNHPIQAQLQIQPSQHQPQINYALEEVGSGMSSMDNQSYQIQATTSTGQGSGQVSGTIMSIVSSFISPGATALQVDNNLIIYNPSGQIIQIPLPSNHSSTHSQAVASTSTNSSSSGLQFQTAPASTATSTDFSWIDSALAASSPVSIPSNSQQFSSIDYPSSIIQQQHQYSTPVTMQYNSPTVDHHNNEGFAMAAPSAEQHAISESNSYYNLQNVELLPTNINSCSYLPPPPTTQSQSSSFIPIQDLAGSSAGVCNDSTVDDFRDIIVKPMDEDETDSGVGITETHQFLETVLPVQMEQVKADPELKQNDEDLKLLTEETPVSINPPATPAATVCTHAVIENVAKKSIIDTDIKQEYFTLSKVTPEPTTTSVEQHESDIGDDLDIKILSCISISDKYIKEEPSDDATISIDEDKNPTTDESKQEENIIKTEFKEEQLLEPCEIKCEVELETFDHKSLPFTKDVCRFVKEKRKLDPPVPSKKYPTPNIPPWLSGYVDDDDELLVAFKSRSNPMKTDICQLCYTWFFNRHDLKQHIKKRHGGSGACHCCFVCGARFVARVLRLRHEKLHKYDLKHRSIVYLRQPDLKFHFAKRFRPAPLSPWYASHIKKVCNLVERLPYTCFDCGIDFISSDFVQDHYERVHASQVCGDCGKVVENSKALTQHEQEYHGLYTITENYVGGAWNLWDHWLCEESIKREEILSNIAYFHNYAPSQAEMPKQFEEDFIERSMEDEDGELRQALKCEDHDTSFADSSFSASFDEDNMECPQLPFACDSCSKSYDNEFDLKRHVKCHGSPSKANLACQYCGRVFKTHSHKKEHERTHTGEKPYVCSVCQRSFIQSSNLKKHMQTHQHSSLQCGTCGKQFIKEASLILHQRAHAQDRKFRCAICDRAYNYASLLKRHMRIHTGEMPYSCESCGMLFHELVSLHYHRKKVHTGERPHKCDTCGRAFILSSDLKKHVQIHLKPHSERPISLRKRSQSRSIDRSDNADTPSSSPNAKSPTARSLKANFLSAILVSEDNHSYTISEEIEPEIDGEDEEEENRSILSPSPCSSLENEIISNKPAIVRVYARRDPPKPPSNPPTLKEKETEHPKKIDDIKARTSSATFRLVSTPTEANSRHSHLPAGTQQLMQLGNNFIHTPSLTHQQYQAHTPTTQASPMAVSEFEDNALQQIISTRANEPVVEIGGFHYSLSSTEDAALLLSINRGDFHHHTTTVEPFSGQGSETGQSMNAHFATQSTNNVGELPKIDEVLQLSGLNEFNDLLVVPEASSEIEIILDDKHNRSMQ